MEREIVLDTETTGFKPSEGDKIVEIGCVELINHVPTDKYYHIYINPEREMPMEAFNIHGLSDEFLADKPIFADIADEFLAFIGNSPLIIHNAPFDLGFLNFELKKINYQPIKNKIIDTVLLARKVHPGARVSLDALCKHYGVDNSHRDLHGALLDAKILAQIYLELIGGRQVSFSLAQEGAKESEIMAKGEINNIKTRPTPLKSRLSKEELAAHKELVKILGENSLWSRLYS